MRRSTARNPRTACDDPECLHVAPPRASDRSLAVLEREVGVVELERTRVVGAKSPGFEADRASIEDVAFDACDLSNAAFARGSVTRAAFVECKMTGFVFGEGVRLEDVVFDRCILDDALFDGAELVRVAFERCRMNGVGLRGSRCEGVAFDGCDLSKADLSGTTTARGTNVRVHACVLASVALDARLVGALVVDAEGARSIVSALGARVSEERARRTCARPERSR